MNTLVTSIFYFIYLTHQFVMCSLRDFPELRDHSLTDKNASMNVSIKRIKPEVGTYIFFSLPFMVKNEWYLLMDFFSRPNLWWMLYFSMWNILKKFKIEMLHLCTLFMFFFIDKTYNPFNINQLIFLLYRKSITQILSYS